MYLKTFAILLAIVAFAGAAPPQNPYAYAPQPYAPTPESAVDPNPPHYNFQYDVSDPITGDQHSQQETRNDDVVQGSYSLVEPDGSVRVVNYHASDAEGFVAEVQKNPGSAAPGVGVKALPSHPKSVPYQALPSLAYYQPLASSPEIEVVAPVQQPQVQYGWYQYPNGLSPLSQQVASREPISAEPSSQASNFIQAPRTQPSSGVAALQTSSASFIAPPALRSQVRNQYDASAPQPSSQNAAYQASSGSSSAPFITPPVLPSQDQVPAQPDASAPQPSSRNAALQALPQSRSAASLVPPHRAPSGSSSSPLVTYHPAARPQRPPFVRKYHYW